MHILLYLSYTSFSDENIDVLLNADRQFTAGTRIWDWFTTSPCAPPLPTTKQQSYVTSSGKGASVI